MSQPPTIVDQVTPEKTNVHWFIDEVHRHDASLKNYVRHSFPAVKDVEDLVQESYLRVWKRQLARPIAEVSGSVNASVKGFLFQVARRLAIDLLRHKQRSPIDAVAEMGELQVMEDRASVHESVCASQEFDLLLEAIDGLPARCREVVILRKLNGLSPGDTAERLGITEDTVHIHTRNGLQRVQGFLRSRGVIREHSS